MSDLLQTGDQVKVTLEGPVEWIGPDGQFRIGGLVIDRESEIFRDARVVPRPLRVGDVVKGWSLAGPQPEGAVFRSIETGVVWMRTPMGYWSSRAGSADGEQFRNIGTFEVVYLP